MFKVKGTKLFSMDSLSFGKIFARMDSQILVEIIPLKLYCGYKDCHTFEIKLNEVYKIHFYIANMIDKTIHVVKYASTNFQPKFHWFFKSGKYLLLSISNK